MSHNILPADCPVTKRETVVYGLFGGGGFTFSYIMFSSVIVYYFTDVLGIGAAAAGVLLLIARVWDGINDPLMGIIIDKTNSRWGKNRPYVLVGGVLMSVFTVLLFTNPHFESESSRLAWAYFTYIGYGMSYTMCTVSMGSLPSRLVADRQGITKLASAFYMGSGGVSIFASLTFMSFIERFAGAEGNIARGYQGTAILAAGILFVSTVTLALSVKERNLQGEAPKRIKVIEAVKVMITNVHYLGFIISSSVLLFGFYVSAGVIMYYCIYNLGSQDHYTPLLICDYATPIIAAIIIPYISTKLERKKIVYLSTFVVAGGYILRYLTGDSNTFVMVILAAIAGFAIALSNILYTPIALDCAIYSEYKTGLQLQGTFAAAYSILGKCAAGLAGAFLGFFLDYIGYVENAPAQTEEVLQGLKFCATLGVAIAAIASAVVFMLMYHLKNEDLERMNEENMLRRNVSAG